MVKFWITVSCQDVQMRIYVWGNQPSGARLYSQRAFLVISVLFSTTYLGGHKYKGKACALLAAGKVLRKCGISSVVPPVLFGVLPRGKCADEAMRGVHNISVLSWCGESEHVLPAQRKRTPDRPIRHLFAGEVKRARSSPPVTSCSNPRQEKTRVQKVRTLLAFRTDVPRLERLSATGSKTQESRLFVAEFCRNVCSEPLRGALR